MMNKLDNYTFDEHPLFEKEFNKIIRKHKCPSLEEDFERLKKVLVQKLEESNQIPEPLCYRISGLNKNVSLPAFIVKNFRCEKINKGSRSGFRITFIFSREHNLFYFTEIYNKNQKNVEDKERINKLFN